MNSHFSTHLPRPLHTSRRAQASGRTTFLRLGLALGLVMALVRSSSSATFYRPGDIVENFRLVNRATREPVALEDLAGRIVFLEWFAWWCTFCQAAAPQVDEGIVEWYRERGGNPAGIPVLHVAVNLQANQEPQTQNFVQRSGFGLVLEDFNRGLANRFQNGGQPIFAIINGVTNSPSHRPWELLAHQDGYGQRDFRDSLSGFRRAIDAVEASPIRIAGIERGTNHTLRLQIQDVAGGGFLERSDDLLNWQAAFEIPPGGAGAHTVEWSSTNSAQSFFRVRRATRPTPSTTGASGEGDTGR